MCECEKNFRRFQYNFVARGIIPYLARVSAPLSAMKAGATNAVAVGDLICYNKTNKEVVGKCLL
ncbi:MAG: hypothetical protein HW390_1913 [Candidatus Brocadiaceae bacterium]|nr:hypothetical protein [Candidatus Brocadiaceae bacterium]